MIIIELLFFIFFIFLSALFSSSETALFAISRARLIEYEASSSRIKKTIALLMNNYETTLIAIILGNTFVNVALTILSESLLGSLMLPDWLVIFLSAVVSILVLLIWGEVIPKSMALANSVKFAHASALFIYYFKLALAPIIWLLNIICDIGLNLLGKIKNEALNYEEHGEFINLAVEKGAFSFKEGTFIKNILNLQEQRISSIMVGRVDLEVVKEGALIADIVPIISQKQQLFIPLCKNDIDDCEKIIVSKKFFLLDKVVKLNYLHSDAVVGAQFIPENISLIAALKFMQKRNLEVVLVADEYGRVSGLVSLEDIYEFILGDIVDEYEEPSAIIKKYSKNEWVIGGVSPTNYLLSICKNEEVNNNMTAILEKYEAATISGLFAEELQRLPMLGDKIELADFSLRVEQLDHKRVTKVFVKLKNTSKDGDN